VTFRGFDAIWDGYLFKVVDLPDDGLPTRPMRGSRGILGGWRGTRKMGRNVAQNQFFLSITQIATCSWYLGYSEGPRATRVGSPRILAAAPRLPQPYCLATINSTRWPLDISIQSLLLNFVCNIIPLISALLLRLPPRQVQSPLSASR
jgi:hypothetical protein